MAASLVTVVGLVQADPKTYVGGGDVAAAADCGPAHTDGTPDGIGAVCFGAGHVTPDGAGMATFTINDGSGNLASGFLCQDLDFNNVCGDGAGPGIAFCGGVTVSTGGGWSPGADTWIFIDGPFWGNPVLSPCGSLAMGTMGEVSHT